MYSGIFHILLYIINISQNTCESIKYYLVLLILLFFLSKVFRIPSTTSEVFVGKISMLSPSLDVLKRPATAFKISLIDKKAYAIPLARAINFLLNFTPPSSFREFRIDGKLPLAPVRHVLAITCECTRLHRTTPHEEANRRDLIYKIVCFLVIAKVTSREKLL